MGFVQYIVEVQLELYLVDFVVEYRIYQAITRIYGGVGSAAYLSVALGYEVVPSPKA